MIRQRLRLFFNKRMTAPPPGGGEYDADAEAYFAAHTAQEADPWKQAHSDFIAGLKADGLWTGIDWLLFFWANSKQAAFVNARYPSESATESGTLTHSAGHYMAGDNAAAYLILAAQGAHGGATQNDNGGGFHVIAEDAGSAGIKQVVGSTANATLKLDVARTSGNAQFRAGDGTSDNGLGQMNPKNGFWYVSRDNDSANKKAYRNDTLITTVARTSTALGSNAMWLWRNSTGYSAEGLGLFVCGEGWDATQLAAFNARKATLIAAISA